MVDERETQMDNYSARVMVVLMAYIEVVMMVVQMDSLVADLWVYCLVASMVDGTVDSLDHEKAGQREIEMVVEMDIPMVASMVVKMDL